MNNSFLSQESSSNSVAKKISSLDSGSKKQTELTRRYFIVGERRLSNYWWASVIFLGGFGFLLTGISSYLKYNILANAFQIFNIITLAFGTHGPSLMNSLLSNNLEAINQSLASNIVTLTDNSFIAFFPQGLLMCFYGSLGVLLSLYWWLLIYWDVGGGFNEFNKKDGFMRIFRWGYPGKNRRIQLTAALQDIEAIRVEFKQSQGLLASEQTIYVRLLSTPLADQANVAKTTTLTLRSDSGGEYPKAPPSVIIKRERVKLEGLSTNKGLKEKREIPLGGIGQPLTLKEIEKQASELANFLQVGLEGL